MASGAIGIPAPHSSTEKLGNLDHFINPQLGHETLDGSEVGDDAAAHSGLRAGRRGQAGRRGHPYFSTEFGSSRSS